MKYINEWKSFNVSPEEKMSNLVNKILNNNPGGDSFFDKVDDIIKDPNNIDIILSIFNRIYQKYGNNYNLSLSGSFGSYILSLIKSKKIKCKGTIVLFNGSVTSHKNKMGLITKDKNVEVKYNNDDINDKRFIFVDDSYYSGTTEKLINQYLNTSNSSIIYTYVIYDGNDQKDNNRYSLYKYYDHHNGRKLSSEDLLKKAYKIDIDIIDEIKPLIDKGDIKTNRDLISRINDIYKKSGMDKYIDPRNFNYDNQI